MKNIIAKAEIVVNAPVERVWGALITPEAIRQYMFDTNVVSDWEEGSAIVWKGEWEGKTYEDKGKILAFQKNIRLSYSHYSPLSGKPDAPESYHTVTIELKSEGPKTHVTLTQDNNATEEVREHSEKNWQMVLGGLKNLLEH